MKYIFWTFIMQNCELPIYSLMYSLECNLFSFVTKCFLEHVSLCFQCSQFKFEWQESVCLCTIAVDHNTSKNGKLTCIRHPVLVENIFNELFCYKIHLINKSCLFIIGSQNVINVWCQEMFDAIHLMIFVTRWKIGAWFVCFKSS